jgi:hypothetical protein
MANKQDSSTEWIQWALSPKPGKSPAIYFSGLREGLEALQNFENVLFNIPKVGMLEMLLDRVLTTIRTSPPSPFDPRIQSICDYLEMGMKKLSQGGHEEEKTLNLDHMDVGVLVELRDKPRLADNLHWAQGQLLCLETAVKRDASLIKTLESRVDRLDKLTDDPTSNSYLGHRLDVLAKQAHEID